MNSLTLNSHQKSSNKKKNIRQNRIKKIKILYKKPKVIKEFLHYERLQRSLTSWPIMNKGNI
jgi:hypothetical protein